MQYEHFAALVADMGLTVEKICNTHANAGLTPMRALFDALPIQMRWNEMGHPGLLAIKQAGTSIFIFVPRTLQTQTVSGTKKSIYPPRILISHWSSAAAPHTKQVQPGQRSLALVDRHGGFWASDRRGIKPVRGAPVLWALLPPLDINCHDG